jgi:hypothetical protein
VGFDQATIERANSQMRMNQARANFSTVLNRQSQQTQQSMGSGQAMAMRLLQETENSDANI